MAAASSNLTNQFMVCIDWLKLTKYVQLNQSYYSHWWLDLSALIEIKSDHGEPSVKQTNKYLTFFSGSTIKSIYQTEYKSKVLKYKYPTGI